MCYFARLTTFVSHNNKKKQVCRTWGANQAGGAVTIHHNAAVNVFLDPPHRGAAWGLPRGLPGGLLFVQAPGVWGFAQVLSPDWNHGICPY